MPTKVPFLLQNKMPAYGQGSSQGGFSQGNPVATPAPGVPGQSLGGPPGQSLGMPGMQSMNMAPFPGGDQLGMAPQNFSHYTQAGNSGFGFSPGPIGGPQFSQIGQAGGGGNVMGNPVNLFGGGMLPGQLGSASGFSPRGYTPLRPYAPVGNINNRFQRY